MIQLCEIPRRLCSLWNQSSVDISMDTTNLTRTWDEIYSQIIISAPTTISLLLYKLPWFISLHFAGQLGPQELSAAALATTICNVTGMSVSLGMSSAMSTLTGQTLGAMLLKDNCSLKCRPLRNDDSSQTESNKWSWATEETAKSRSYETVSERISILSPKQNELCKDGLSPIVTLLFRGMLLPYLIIIPVGIWWICGIKQQLIYLGQEERVSDITEVRAKMFDIMYLVHEFNVLLVLFENAGPGYVVLFN